MFFINMNIKKYSKNLVEVTNEIYSYVNLFKRNVTNEKTSGFNKSTRETWNKRNRQFREWKPGKITDLSNNHVHG